VHSTGNGRKAILRSPARRTTFEIRSSCVLDGRNLPRISPIVGCSRIGLGLLKSSSPLHGRRDDVFGRRVHRSTFLPDLCHTGPGHPQPGADCSLLEVPRPVLAWAFERRCFHGGTYGHRVGRYAVVGSASASVRKSEGFVSQSEAHPPANRDGWSERNPACRADLPSPEAAHSQSLGRPSFHGVGLLFSPGRPSGRPGRLPSPGRARDHDRVRIRVEDFR
jgi:hypothetical protein